MYYVIPFCLIMILVSMKELKLSVFDIMYWTYLIGHHPGCPDAIEPPCCKSSALLVFGPPCQSTQ